MAKYNYALKGGPHHDKTILDFPVKVEEYLDFNGSRYVPSGSITFACTFSENRCCKLIETLEYDE